MSQPMTRPDPVRECCADVARATVHMQLPNGSPPLVRMVGPELAESLCASLADMLANRLPAALVPTLAGDVLQGAEPIAEFLGLTSRQIYHQQDKLPLFRVGNLLCARKSTLLAWIEAQEQAGRKAGA